VDWLVEANVSEKLAVSIFGAEVMNFCHILTVFFTVPSSCDSDGNIKSLYIKLNQFIVQIQKKAGISIKETC
jgi:hypothetical protein